MNAKSNTETIEATTTAGATAATAAAVEQELLRKAQADKKMEEAGFSAKHPIIWNVLKSVGAVAVIGTSAYVGYRTGHKKGVKSCTTPQIPMQLPEAMPAAQ